MAVSPAQHARTSPGALEPANVLGIMALILALALLLRGHSLASQGFMYWDEGTYALEGEFLADTGQRLLGTSPERSEVPWGRPPNMVKPTHSFLIALSILGLGPTDLAALIPSLLLGTLTVLALFLLGRELYSTGTGLLAAAFLAVLPLHVAYSRQALSEANTIFFFTVSALFYWKSRAPREHPRRMLAAAGIFLGLTATSNYRLILMGLVFVACELVYWAIERQQSRRDFVRRSLVIAYTSLLPAAAWVLFFHGLRAYWAGTGLPLRYLVITYEDQFTLLWNLVNSFSRPLFGDPDLLYYPWVLWVFVGPALVLAGGLFAVLRVRVRKTIHRDLLLLGWLIVPALFYSVLTDKAPRCLAILLPALALAGARGLLLAHSRLALQPRRPALFGRLALVVLAVAILLEGAIGSWEMAQLRGGYGKATRYLRERGIEQVIAGQGPVVYFLGTGNLGVSEMPEDLAALRTLYQRGYRYALLDDQSYLKPQHRTVAAALELALRPVLAVPDTVKQGPLFHLEHSEWMKLNLASTVALHREIRETRGRSEVRLYDLGQYFESAGR